MRKPLSLETRIILRCGALSLIVASLGLGAPPAAWSQTAPDLVVTEVDVSAVVTDCQTLTLGGSVVATVKNIGQAGTGVASSVVFFADRNGNGVYDSGTDLVLGSGSIGSLAPNQTGPVAAVVAGTAAFADDLIYAFADAGQTVLEANELNNLSHSGLNCTFEPIPGSFSPVLEWAWNSSSILPNSLNVMMTPSVIDLNGDGVPDVVFGSTESTGGALVEVGVLRALDGETGAELFTVTDPTLRISTTASIATGDIDGDGWPEIIASDDSGVRLIAFEHNGVFKWRSPNLEFVYWGAPALADLDNDGKPEIIIGRQVLNSDGTIRWTGAGGRASQGNVGSISCVADVDLDGKPDVVAGNTVYTAAGSILWQANLPDGHNALANFDGDAYPEIVLVSSGYVWLLEHTGAVKWGPVAIPGGGAGGPPTIADYDNDGQPEIGVAGASRYAVFETNGTLKWASSTQDASSNRTGSSVFDFDGDGSAEVVYRDELYLRVYRGSDGTVLFQTPMSSCTWHEYVLVADVDADGNAEIVAVANNNCGYGPQRGVYVFGDANDSWVTTRQIWNQHTYHITNVNDDGTIPANEVNSWATFNSYRQNVQNVGSVLAAPDLTASFLRFDPSGCPNVAKVIARIGNGGSTLAPAALDVAFYNSSAGNTLLGVVQTTQKLMPGQWEDVTLVLPLPVVTPITITVIADQNGGGVGKVSECDEQNNACSGRFDQFCACVADLAARPKLSKIQLTWTHVGAHHYNIYRSLVAGGPYTKVGTTTSTWSTFLDSTVVAGKTYYYVVREANAKDVELCQSNEARATTTARR